MPPTMTRPDQDNIKSMRLYHRPDRILIQLRAQGFDDNAPVPVSVLSALDQLHYHGTEALDVAIARSRVQAGQRVLEVGAGWGGCARYIASKSGARVTAIELQHDYNEIARSLTKRAGFDAEVAHINADFLAFDAGDAGFDHVVSWLALFHIPNRDTYLSKICAALKPGGSLFVEDLYEAHPPSSKEKEDFAQHLFPNSLVPREEYLSSLGKAGLEILSFEDMTDDWTQFTAERLAAFCYAEEAYSSVHGPEGFAAVKLFYEKMAGYFSRGLVGGIRLHATKPGSG